ncbi:MAG: hypothetical protein B0A82_03455 [Alkalinema sp. CACIAM 70d]|nr:MAG: hypothetical protein B0A82_03455 [Alkalinema sp. CACIAM 70d]
MVCKFTPTASRDMEGIMDYIADRISFEAAERFLLQCNQKCTRLARFPNIGRLRNELLPGNGNARSWTID